MELAHVVLPQSFEGEGLAALDVLRTQTLAKLQQGHLTTALDTNHQTVIFKVIRRRAHYVLPSHFQDVYYQNKPIRFHQTPPSPTCL